MECSTSWRTYQGTSNQRSVVTAQSGTETVTPSQRSVVTAQSGAQTVSECHRSVVTAAQSGAETVSQRSVVTAQSGAETVTPSQRSVVLSQEPRLSVRGQRSLLSPSGRAWPVGWAAEAPTRRSSKSVRAQKPQSEVRGEEPVVAAEGARERLTGRPSRMSRISRPRQHRSLGEVQIGRALSAALPRLVCVYSHTGKLHTRQKKGSEESKQKQRNRTAAKKGMYEETRGEARERSNQQEATDNQNDQAKGRTNNPMKTRTAQARPYKGQISVRDTASVPNIYAMVHPRQRTCTNTQSHTF